MTKRTLYAVAELGGSALVAAMLLLVSPLVRVVSAQGAACATCVAIAASPEQAASLPTQLDGMEVLLRVPPDGGTTAVDALKLVGSRSGRPGLLLTALPEGSPAAATL